MNIPLSRRLSFKQTAITVLVAFLIGTLLSLFQVAADYASEDASINREIEALLEVSFNPASRIAFNRDAELAQELVFGLLHSPAVIEAEILENNGHILASVRQSKQDGRLRLLSDFLFGERREFRTSLSVSHAFDQPLGILRLEIDPYIYGHNFIRRAGMTFLSGFVRSLLLSLVLVALFYRMLTKPLIAASRELHRSDPQTLLGQPIRCPSGHENDEIGLLINGINRHLSRINEEVGQRQAAEHRLTQYLGALENIIAKRTEALKSANAQLLQSNEELEQARSDAWHTAQVRAAFLAQMSHEIRTPLNGMLGMLGLALERPRDYQQHQQLQVARNSGRFLLDLLNNILDLSKFESGQLELERIPFDLGNLAEEIAAMLSQDAASAVELSCLISPQLPAQLIGDPTRIRQIIGNLLANALKFTRHGRVELLVDPLEQGVRIQVRDTGIGIPEQARTRIFQPFAQAGAGTTRQYGGTGLGLALTRKLCDSMQGTLQLSSVEGQGSCFTVELPLEASQPPLAPASVSGRALLLGRTDSSLAQLLARWLPHWGMHYQQAEDPRSLPDGLDLLILQDSTWLSVIRNYFQGTLLLVLPYNRFITPEQKAPLEPLIQLPQPLTRQALLDSVQQSLRPSQVQPQASLPLPEPQATPQAPRVLLVEDNQVNQMVAEGMLGKLGCQVRVAHHGQEALQMLEQQPFDLILMDCNMPVMDGYRASQSIRRRVGWSHLPIIALTANVLPEERERCQQVGMDDYIGKPFSLESLHGILERWLPEHCRAGLVRL